MRSAPARRLAELRAKLQSLRSELDTWRRLTEQQPPLKRHHSQIRLLDATLNGLLDSTRKELEQQPEDASVLAKAVEWENEILAAHSIWEVFRSKYVLRQNETFRDHLAACDDLAWECYAPAWRKLSPGVPKEPPLVYLSSTWSPFAQSRDTNFQNELRLGASGASAFTGEDFQKVLGELPFPLVSLPWYQAFHLPGAIILAHEVGHVVDNDFDLRAQIVARLDAAGLAFANTWKGWAAEIFADVYGCLAMGPAFAGAMMDLLATSATAVQNERRIGGTHPTRALRVRIILHVLGKAGHAADVPLLRATWEASFPPSKVMDDVGAEMEKVVDIVLAGPYGGFALTDIVSLPPSITVAKIRVLAGQGQAAQLRDYDDSDPRYLFAAAQLLHQDPVPNQKAEAFQLLVAQAIRKGENAFRSRGKPVAKADLDAEMAAREVEAAARGGTLRDWIRKAAASSPADAAAPPGPQTP